MELVFLITVIKGYYSLQRFLEHLNSGFKLVTSCSVNQTANIQLESQ